jgi:hypothetical protein
MVYVIKLVLTSDTQGITFICPARETPPAAMLLPAQCQIPHHNKVGTPMARIFLFLCTKFYIMVENCIVVCCVNTIKQLSNLSILVHVWQHCISLELC